MKNVNTVARNHEMSESELDGVSGGGWPAAGAVAAAAPGIAAAAVVVGIAYVADQTLNGGKGTKAVKDAASSAAQGASDLVDAVTPK